MDDGTKYSGQFQINAINNLTGNPSITALKNNNFIVTWNDNVKIYGQILNDNGIKIGLQFNITSNGTHSYAPIIALANGNFVVIYRCFPNICATIFYNNGIILKSQFIVNTFINIDQLNSISSISSSNFMIVWESYGQDVIGTYDLGIYGQSFTSSGSKIGNEFRVNTYIIGDQINPSIASLSNDNYIVTWHSYNQDKSENGVYGQILDSSGNKIGIEFKVNAYTNSNQESNPSVALLINTNFVIVWQSNIQDGSGYGIFGNIYQSDGLVIGFDACPLNCQSCDNKENCITCDRNFTLQQNGLCRCFDGFYLVNNNICISKFIILNYFYSFFVDCPKECKTCNNSTSCQSCSNGFYLYEDTCLTCQNTCKTCDGPTNTDCNSCNSGYYFSPANPNISQASCPIGYYPDIESSTCFGIILLSYFLIIGLFRMS